ncbi:ATP-dependent nuclease [Salinimicrobium sp. WS361]|uniref:ATP-dependent nuclease n=1 Tax=Salinimicrobium sp. WS361 TaxID=3425123 RepID=UPI003D6FB827
MQDYNFYIIEDDDKFEINLNELVSHLEERYLTEAFFLTPLFWDDYGNKTSFSLTLIRNGYHHIGKLKIIRASLKDNYDTLEELPPNFKFLEKDYCSLGFDMDFYRNIKTYFPNNFEEVLRPLRDCAFYPAIRDEFETLEIYQHSLVRFSEAQKAMTEARSFLLNEPIDKIFNFNYRTSLINCTAPHEVAFNFETFNELPKRITTIIGKNGTGKTQFLANLAIDLSGGEGTTEKVNIKNSFQPRRPSFSRVISVSYSIFDKFPRPRPNDTYSYKYCGLKDEEGKLLNDFEVSRQIEDAIKKIEDQTRTVSWYLFLFNLFGKEEADSLLTNLFRKKKDLPTYLQTERLSSGQSFLIYVITEIIANIKEDSIVLLDEPEMHLHPNAIAKFIRSFENLMKEFNSYAVIATHSPIILQEIPSKNVRVFEREGNTPFIHKLHFESFGESIENITQEIFQTKDVDDNYKSFFKKLSKELSYQEVLALFDNNLGRFAKAYLLNLYENPSDQLND